MGGDDEGTVAREDRVQATARTAVTEDEQRTAAGGQEHGRTSSELTWTRWEGAEVRRMMEEVRGTSSWAGSSLARIERPIWLFS